MYVRGIQLYLVVKVKVLTGCSWATADVVQWGVGSTPKLTEVRNAYAKRLTHIRECNRFIFAICVIHLRVHCHGRRGNPALGDLVQPVQHKANFRSFCVLLLPTILSNLPYNIQETHRHSINRTFRPASVQDFDGNSHIGFLFERDITCNRLFTYKLNVVNS